MTLDNIARAYNDIGASDDQAPYDSLQAAPRAHEKHALLAALQGTGVVSGLWVSQHAATMQVDYAAGLISHFGVRRSIPAGTVTIADNNTGYARIDSIWIDSTGTITVQTGTPAAEPAAVELHRDANGRVDIALIADIEVPPDVQSTTGILDAHITQQGVPPATGGNSSISGSGPAIDVDLMRQYDGSWATAFNGGGWFNAYTDGQIVTDTDGTIYALTYNSHCQPVIWQRNPTTFAWKKVTLSAVSGNPLASPMSLDTHNYGSIGIGSDGYIHVCANMHNDVLRYCRSNAPNDIGADATHWTSYAYDDAGGAHNSNSSPSASSDTHTGGMTGTAENWYDHTTYGGTSDLGVTYPNFLRLPDGTLIFTHRWGTSGDGSQYFKRWNGSSWSDLGTGTHQIIDGLTENLSPYPNRFVIDGNGDLHVFFVWRHTSDANSSDGIYYCKITGLQASGTLAAVDSTGGSLTLPIRFGSNPAERPFTWAAASGTSDGTINNSCGAVVDANGFPHAVYQVQYDDGTSITTQFLHVWNDGTWHEEIVTSFHDWSKLQGSTPHIGIRPSIVATREGGVFIVGEWRGEGLSGALWAWDCTPGATDRRPFKLHEIPDTGELTYDARAMTELNLLRFVINSDQQYYNDPGDNRQSTNPDGGGSTGTFASDAGLEAPGTLTGVVTIDLAQIEAFRSKAVRLPGIRSVNQSWGGSIVECAYDAIRSPTVTTPSNANQFVIPQDIYAGSTALFDQESTDTPFVGWGHSITTILDRVADNEVRSGNARVPSMMVTWPHAGKRLFCRLHVRMKVVSGAGWLAACINSRREQIIAQSGSTSSSVSQSRVAAQVVTDASSQYLTSSWVAMPDFDDLAGDLGILQMFLWLSDNSTLGQVDFCGIELGALYV